MTLLSFQQMVMQPLPWGSDSYRHPFKVREPASLRDEAVEVLWENLRCAAARASAYKSTVYFFQARQLGLIKIGKTNNLFNRSEQLACGCPDELRFIWAYNAPETEERRLHGIFAHLRVRGEWFWPAKSLVEFLDSGPVIDWSGRNSTALLVGINWRPACRP